MSSHDVKSTNAKQIHQKEVGRERCSHTCPERVCVNMKGSLDWEKEGHSVCRHESLRKHHLKCAQGCTRNFKLQPTAQSGKGKEKESTTPSAPTPSAPSDILDKEMDVDPPFLFDTADPGGSSNMPVAGPSNVGNSIIIHLLFYSCICLLINLAILSSTEAIKSASYKSQSQRYIHPPLIINVNNPL